MLFSSGGILCSGRKDQLKKLWKFSKCGTQAGVLLHGLQIFLSQIQEIEGTFPRSKVYLHLFHRRQAWKQWLRKDNLDVPGKSEEIFNLWVRIANAPSEEEFLATTEKVHSYPLLKRNKDALHYFNNQWLPEYERWVKAYEDQENFLANITTTNDVESLNKRLKHFFPSALCR